VTAARLGPVVDHSVLTGALTVLAGVLTGALSAAFGVGGAVISTPAIRLLGVPAALAVGTTLPAILPGAASGTARYARAGLARWDVVARAAGPGALGAVAGARLSRAVPGDGHGLMIATAVLLAVSAARMARRPEPPPAAAGGTGGPQPPAPAPWGPAAAVGAGAGLLSGLLGIGGGIVLVPAFSELLGLPLKAAVATSLACVGLLALPATLAHWSLGGIDWPTAALLALGVVPGARLGARAALAASDRRLRAVVATTLGATAAVYLVAEVAALAG